MLGYNPFALRGDALEMTAVPTLPALRSRIAIPQSPYSDDAHICGLHWTEHDLAIYVDGYETLRIGGEALRDVPPMYLIANLAVSGSWGGIPGDGTHFPAIMRIGYIRAYTSA